MDGTTRFLMGMAGVAALMAAGCARVEVTEGASPGVHVRDPNAPYARVRMNSVGEESFFLTKEA